MKDVSYRSDVVEAFIQYVRNIERLTPAQWTLIHSFTPQRSKSFYRVAAEILLDLHCGAEIHEVGDYKTGKEAEVGLRQQTEELLAKSERSPMSKQHVSIVYEIVDEDAWRDGVNPLHYEHYGLRAVCVSAGDLAGMKDKVRELEGALEMGQRNCDDVYNDLRVERDDALIQLVMCERWFAKFSPTSQLIDGRSAEHPMLTAIRTVLARRKSK